MFDQRLTDTGRNDFTEVPAAGEAATIVVDGGQWRAEVAGDCLRFWADGATTQCWSLTYEVGSGGAGRVEGRGHRLRWVLWAADTPVTMRWWSSSNAGTERTSVEVAPGLQLIVFELDPDEAAYGLQLWDQPWTDGGALVWASADP